MKTLRSTEHGQKTRKHTLRDALLWVLLALLIVGVIGYRVVLGNLREQSALSVRSAILTTAEQCYAVEGAYPSSIDYLEQAYGLRVNKKDYHITYVVLAGSLPPTVSVVPR